MRELTITIPSIARRNVQVAYETSQQIDPSVSEMLASIHKKHKALRPKRSRAKAKKIYQQPIVEFVLPEKIEVAQTLEVIIPAVRIVTVTEKNNRWFSRKIHIKTSRVVNVPNRLSTQNMILYSNIVLNWLDKVVPYQAEQDAAYEIRTRQKHQKPIFPIPINTKTAIFPNKVHTWWLALPNNLRPVAIEPPKFYSVESDFEKPSCAINPDIPDNLAFDVMGCNDRTNEHLDYKVMDDRHFRESCVVVGTGFDAKNLFLEPKHGHSRHVVVDANGQLKTTIRGRLTKPQTFMDPSWLMNKLQCPFELAFELKEAFKRLDITTWPKASRIINGLVGTGKITIPFAKWDSDSNRYISQYSTPFKGVRFNRAKGLISYTAKIGPPDLRGLEHAITCLAKMARELEDVTVEWGNMINLDLNEDAPGIDDDPLWAGVELSPEEVPFIIDDLDQLGGDSNPYTGHVLVGDGSDGLPSEIISCLKSATDFNLANLAKRVRPNWTEEDGKWIPPNRGMNDKQTSQFWSYWQARRAEIKSVVAVDPQVAHYLSDLRSLTTRGRAATYIYALKDGKRFNEKGIELHAAGVRVIPSALKVLWEQFNLTFATDEPIARRRYGKPYPR